MAIRILVAPASVSASMSASVSTSMSASESTSKLGCICLFHFTLENVLRSQLMGTAVHMTLIFVREECCIALVRMTPEPIALLHALCVVANIASPQGFYYLCH